MPAILMVVAVHPDAFPLATDRSVLEAMVDYGRRPCGGDEQDIHPDMANLSQEIPFQPFQDRGLHPAEPCRSSTPQKGPLNPGRGIADPTSRQGETW